MKIVISPKIRGLILFILLTSISCVLNAAPSVTLTPVNGTCVSDCKIVVNVTNTTGTVTYSLINYPTPGNITPPTSSNTFDGLLPGTYTVGVYDASTGSTPVLATTTVTTSYVGISAYTPTTGYNSTEYCKNTGTLNIRFIGGKAPYRIKITNTVAPYNTKEIASTYSTSYNFTELPAGKYIYEIEDACAQWQQNIPGSYIQVSESGKNLQGTTFTSLDAAPGLGNYNRVYAQCNTIYFYFYYSAIKINGGAITPGTHNNLKFYLEYPAYSGNWIGPRTAYSSTTFSSSNYNRTQTNGDKYRIKVVHPCTNAETFSPVYTVPAEYEEFAANAYNSRTYSNYCTSIDNPYIRVGLLSSASTNYATKMQYYNCGPYTVTVKQGATTIASKTHATGTSYTHFYKSDGFNIVGGQTYTVIVSRATPAYSRTYTVTVPAVPAQINFDPAYIDYTANGYNFNRTCDFTTTTIFANHNMSSYVSEPVTYSIIAPAAYTSRAPITLTNGRGLLWTDLDYGQTYTIRANYGCGTVDENFTLTRSVKDFHISSLAAEMSTTTCGRFNIRAKAYFRNMSSQSVNTTSTGYMYYMQIIDGPDHVGTISNYGRSYSGYDAVISDLTGGGTYKVIFYGYNTPTSYQTINGVYQRWPECYYEERTVTIPEYVRPVINTPLSGGISCETGVAPLTITVLSGDKPPFTYRYKAQGASDATYTPIGFQTSNVFPGVTPGYYTVQVKDNCGSITTQDVRVFNGTDQFVGIIGEIAPGVICEGKSVTLTVLSIGPVLWYKWYYRAPEHDGDNSKWVSIGTNSPTFHIPSASQSDKGSYKVEIHNGSCQLDSKIKIVDIIPPAPTPTITGPTTICPGNTATLTAHTTVTLPTYTWYKNGVLISGANSSTYTTGDAGTYSVEVTPFEKCPSNPSAGHSLQVKSPDAPTISGASGICVGESVVLTANPAIAGATYAWYKDGGSSPVFTSSTTNTYTATASGSYTVTVNTGTNCTSAKSFAHTLTSFGTFTPGSIGAAQSICYNTRPAQLNQSGTPNGGGSVYTYQWQESTTGGAGNWSNILSQTGTSYWPPVLTATKYYRLAVTSLCGTKYTDSVKITVYQQVLGGNIGSNQTICYSATPAAFTSSVAASGGNGSLSYQWEISTNGGATWSLISGATSATYAPSSALTATTHYRRKVTNTCGTTYSNTVIVTVHPQFTAGSIGSSQSICYGATPAAFTSASPATGGDGVLNYQWEISTDGGTTWNSISGATSATYAPPSALTTTTHYRRKVTGGCGTKYSNVVIVTVYALLAPPTVANSTINYCKDASSQSLLTASGASAAANCTLKWYASNGTTVITPPASLNTATSGTTIYYVSQVHNTTLCESNKVQVKVIVHALPAAPNVSAAVICDGQTAKIVVHSPTANYTYKVYKVATGGTAITSVVAPNTMDADIICETLYANQNYYVEAISNYGCVSSTRTLVTVSVINVPASSLSAASLCDGDNIMIKVDPSLNGVTYRAYTLASGGTQLGSPVIGTGGAIYINCGAVNVTAGTTQTFYVEGTTSGVGGCSSQRQAVSVNVKYNAIATTISANDEYICYNTTTTLIANSGVVNPVYKWYNSQTSLTPVYTGQTLPSSIIGNLTATTSYFVSVSGDSHCENKTGAREEVKIYVYGQLTPGAIGNNQNICNGQTPAPFTSVTAPSGGNGTYSYQWQISTDNATWTNITGAISATYTHTSGLTVSTYFRRGVNSNSCGMVYTPSIFVNVYGDFQPGTIGTNQTICNGSTPAPLTSLTLPTGGGGTYNYQWQISTDNTTWTNISGANAATYTPPALSQTTYYKRGVTSGHSCGTVYSNVITITVRDIIAYPDFRVMACAENTINLTKYIDTTYFHGIKWQPSTLFYNGGVDDGRLLNVTQLVPGMTYSYKYEATSTCQTEDGTLYLTIITDGQMEHSVDTVKICWEQALAINLNAIFGIEARGTYTCVPAAAGAHMATLSAMPFTGAAILNGKAIWNDASISLSGDGTKKITVTYTPNATSCLGGKSYKVVIVLTPDLTI